MLSVSSDQSTRLHAPWVTPNGKVHHQYLIVFIAPFVFQSSWHELARPQIHGYDLQCIALLSTLRFTSGADEKVFVLTFYC